MYKQFTLLFFLIFFCASSQINKDAVLGKWMATDKTVAVHIYKSGNNFKAKVIWFDDGFPDDKVMNYQKDSLNPDPKLRTRKVIGLDVLKNLKFNDKKQFWENGKIYDSSSGRTWDALMHLNKDGQLCVRGYWKWALLGKTIYFNKF